MERIGVEASRQGLSSGGECRSSTASSKDRGVWQAIWHITVVQSACHRLFHTVGGPRKKKPCCV